MNNVTNSTHVVSDAAPVALRRKKNIFFFFLFTSRFVASSSSCCYWAGECLFFSFLEPFSKVSIEERDELLLGSGWSRQTADRHAPHCSNRPTDQQEDARCWWFIFFFYTRKKRGNTQLFTRHRWCVVPLPATPRQFLNVFDINKSIIKKKSFSSSSPFFLTAIPVILCMCVCVYRKENNWSKQATAAAAVAPVTNKRNSLT